MVRGVKYKNIRYLRFADNYRLVKNPKGTKADDPIPI